MYFAEKLFTHFKALEEDEFKQDFLQDINLLCKNYTLERFCVEIDQRLYWANIRCYTQEEEFGPHSYMVYFHQDQNDQIIDGVIPFADLYDE